MRGIGAEKGRASAATVGFARAESAALTGYAKSLPENSTKVTPSINGRLEPCFRQTGFVSVAVCGRPNGIYSPARICAGEAARFSKATEKRFTNGGGRSISAASSGTAMCIIGHAGGAQASVCRTGTRA